MPSKPSHSRGYATLDESAEYLGVTTTTLRRWISQGILPAYRFASRTLRLRLEDIDAMARRVPNAQSTGAAEPDSFTYKTRQS
ncbi:MAG: helix-turn-helix domain-containing protein [Brooklawnia sp.]|jgi:excisionase family DNA binding protein